MLRHGHGRSCETTDMCLSNSGLVCSLGECKCKQDVFWNGHECGII